MLEEFFITLPELPASAEVQEYARKHARPNATPQTLPAWAVVCVVLGGLLSVGTGAFLIALWWVTR